MGRLRVAGFLVGALLTIAAAMTPAKADPSCLSYLVTAPIVGTVQGVRCIPLPGQFDFPIAFGNCQFLPPIGTTVCIGVELNLFLP